VPELPKVPVGKRAPTRLKVFLRGIWQTCKIQKFDLWELDKVEQIEEENLASAQVWTSSILFANILGQI
jgi:hypothetical protein